MERSKLTPKERRELDNLRAESAKNTARMDYIAMMCDVEIPETQNNEMWEERQNV